MKKIAILLVFTLGTFIVNAQSVVEGTKFLVCRSECRSSYPSHSRLFL